MTREQVLSKIEDFVAAMDEFHRIPELLTKEEQIDLRAILDHCEALLQNAGVAR